jgi:hypothetical protein
MYSRRMWQVILLLAGLLCTAAPALAQVTMACPVPARRLTADAGGTAAPRSAKPAQPPRNRQAEQIDAPAAGCRAGAGALDSGGRPGAISAAAGTGTRRRPPHRRETVPRSSPSPQSPPQPSRHARHPHPAVWNPRRAATAAGAGLQVTFPYIETDLSPASATAIRTPNRAAGRWFSFNVVAYAAGTPEDPSTAGAFAGARAACAGAD